MQEFIEYLVKSFVENPQDVTVTRIAGSRSPIYELKVNQSDMGKVIGKHGQTIEAIQTIVHVASQRNERGAKLVLLNPNRRMHEGF